MYQKVLHFREFLCIFIDEGTLERRSKMHERDIETKVVGFILPYVLKIGIIYWLIEVCK